MTEAELMAEINKKRGILEQYRSGKPRVSSSLMRTLEDEIKDLESTLHDGKKLRRRRLFTDECAGGTNSTQNAAGSPTQG